MARINYEKILKDVSKKDKDIVYVELIIKFNNGVIIHKKLGIRTKQRKYSPSQYHQILKLKQQEDKSFSDICRIMELSQSKARNLYATALYHQSKEIKHRENADDKAKKADFTKRNAKLRRQRK